MLTKSLLVFTKSYFPLPIFLKKESSWRLSSEKGFKPESEYLECKGQGLEFYCYFVQQYQSMLRLHSTGARTPRTAWETTVSAEKLGAQGWDLSCLTQPCPLKLSERSAVFYKILLHNTYHDYEGFSANSVCIKWKIRVV